MTAGSVIMQSSDKDKAIGVIGGIGPAATFEFCTSVMKYTRNHVESDHLRQLVDCNPKMSDVNTSILGGASVEPELVAAAVGLERAGADMLVLVCNTAHFYEPAIIDAVKIPFVSMIDVAVRIAARTVPADGTVGVLATDGCIASNIFQNALGARQLREVLPNGGHMGDLMRVLSDVKRNDLSAETIARIQTVMQSLIDAGADCIIVGCTEAMCVIEKLLIDIRVIDPVDELAREVARLATQGRRANPHNRRLKVQL